MIRPPEGIETDRLILRRCALSDARAIFETYAQDEEVTRFMTWRPHTDIGQTKAYLKTMVEAWDKGTEFTWVILLKDHTLIGAVGFRPTQFKSEGGYVLARPYWNKGYTSEAFRALVNWFLAQPEIFRVGSVCDVENSASARVMEKAGMQREGILKRWIIHPQMSDQPRDCYCYSIVKEL